MIVIAGQTFNPAEGTAGPIPQNDREYAIAVAMADSREIFTYTNIHEFRFELLSRKHIVSAAILLNESHAAFASFANSRCNPQFWELTGNGGFLLKKEKRPTDAVRDIFMNGRQYAFECATAIVIVLYKAVLDSIGETAFDRLFADIYLHDWQYDKDLHLVASEPDDIIPGDIAYFDNPDVDPDQMIWQGENAVYLGNGMFYGHGIGIANAEKIISVLNRHRKPQASQSASLQKQIIRPEFRFLSQFSGRLAEPPFGSLRPTAPGLMQKLANSRITAVIGSKTRIINI